MLKSWLMHWPLTDWLLEGDEKVEGKGIKILSLNIAIRNGKIDCKVVWIKYYLWLKVSSQRY